jgi:hypothetical protein
MAIDVAVFEALEEAFEHYDTHNAWSYMLVTTYVAEAFSNDHR